MKLKEMLALCDDTQQVIVIVQKDYPWPAVKGEAATLNKYLCCGTLRSIVCGIGADDGDVLKIWIEEAKDHENTCAD